MYSISMSFQSLFCFSGCGFEKVTAEDLVNNACNMDAIESLDADIALVMESQ